MASKQIGEIIQSSHEIHQALHDYISQHVEESPDFRYASALKYLEEVEQKTQAMLNALPETSKQKIMNTFVRYYPIKWEQEAREILEESKRNRQSKPMDTLLEIRRRLVSIYDFCASNSHLPEVEELMNSVRQFEEVQLQDVNRQLSEYQMGR